MTQPEHFPFIHRLRVRWQEVDAQQVVFNGHYLTYLDVAMSEYWRAVALPYPDAWSHHGGDVFARHHSLSYHAPARLDDTLSIGVRCERVGSSSITIAWAVWADHRLLVTGEAVYVHVDLRTRRPAPVPDTVRHQIDTQARGDGTWQLTLAPWAAQRVAAQAVRRAVFIDEQGVPEDDEWDTEDDAALHAVVCNLAGFPLATGRLITAGEPPGHARVGRMAVLRTMRGAGVGASLMAGLLQAAREQGCRQVALHAQTAARGFYEPFGFKAQGEVFDEVGIDHIRMVADLTPAEVTVRS